ncbi:hypothetical protein L3Q82_004639 [Scortum barcoo]|uniref:Uncharacterized protein n=1 Tax=Scortum barcoo TaxID=214431 RepID=A0ACB8VGU3_9TELE|nr:hypothetical protein L3Q82_004639 [Scortum barcoo]
MRSKQYHQPLKLTAPWEKDAGFGRKLKTYRNHTKIIAQPGIVMKVLRRKRIVLFMAYFLLLVLTMLNLANYKWTKEPQQCNHQMRSTTYQSRSDIRFLYRPSLAKKRQLIYVLTTWRSGSSFFGELFNQNPEVFFLYEPMWHIWQKLYPGDAVSLQGAARDMLSSLYRCDLSVFQLYNSPGGKNFTSLGLFGATLNKVVCSYPLCSAYRKEVVGMVDDKVCKKCPPQSLRLLEEECLKYNTIVIKGVRILDVNVLAPLMEDPSLDLKVIHLVRDPRAVANSRIKSRHGLIRENLQVVRSRDPKLRRIPFVDPGHKANKKDGSDYHSIGAMELAQGEGKYMAVRYEDLVENPVKTLRSIYRFANLTTNHDIETFALNMTSGSSSSSKPFIVSSRNATQAASAWRTVLSIQQIKQVEDYCHHAMSVLGTRRVRDLLGAIVTRTPGRLLSDALASDPIHCGREGPSLRAAEADKLGSEVTPGASGFLGKSWSGAKAQSAAGHPPHHTRDAVGEDALYSTPVERSEDGRGQVDSLHPSQEVQALLCPLNQRRRVH